MCAIAGATPAKVFQRRGPSTCGSDRSDGAPEITVTGPAIEAHRASVRARARRMRLMRSGLYSTVPVDPPTWAVLRFPISESLPDFPVRVSQCCQSSALRDQRSRALLRRSAVGRASLHAGHYSRQRGFVGGSRDVSVTRHHAISGGHRPPGRSVSGDGQSTRPDVVVRRS